MTGLRFLNVASGRILVIFMKEYQIPRHQIASKCYGLVADDVSIHAVFTPAIKDVPKYMNQSGLSRAAIFNAVKASLARLETAYIDLLQIHRFDCEVPGEETMKALHGLVRSGKVRYIGTRSVWCWQFGHLNEVADKNGWTKFISMQNEYSLLYRGRLNAIGVIPWGPPAGGDLARPLGGETTRTKASKGSVFMKRFAEADKTVISRVEDIVRSRQ